MFDNSRIYSPDKSKPHIVFRQRYWRVSKLPRIINNLQRDFWVKAHEFTHKLNMQIDKEKNYYGE